MKDLKTTNTLLLIIAIPVVFYLLKILSFIFVPLILAMFVALLFLPLMRWMNKKKVPKIITLLVVLFIIIGSLKLGGELIKVTSHEIVSTNAEFMTKAELKLDGVFLRVENFFGIEPMKKKSTLFHYFKELNLMKNFGSTIDVIKNTVTMTLTTLFFAILLLFESINFERILNNTLFKRRYSSIKIFRKIEKDVLKFVVVKFAISLLTGIGIGLVCWIFGVSFPVFWGLFAFLINFIQMIGSIISVVLLSLFSYVEIDSSGTLLFFILVIIGVQVLMGSILEPIFMGKTFSINIVTVLIMLMFWGYIWGIPGMIMSIPITVFIKILLEQFPSTKVVAILMSGTPPLSKLR